MKIEVTQDMIVRGTRGNGSRCPVALAFRAARPAARGVYVGSHSIIWMIAGHTYSVETPDDIYAFIEDFDDGEPVSPGTFDLPVTP